MKLSIIIPALNEEQFLPRLLQALSQQTFKDYEIIISDGNSEDQTREIAVGFGCRVVVDSERSPARQRNNGARLAQGEILLFLDADSEIQINNFLADIVTEFQARHLAVAAFYLRFSINKLSYNLCAWGYNLFCWGRQYTAPIGVGAGIMVKKDIHEQLHGFDETLYLAEDYDYCFRAWRLGKFRILKSQKLIYSARRLRQEGGLKTLAKWLLMGRYTLFNIPIRKRIIKYDMGGHHFKKYD